MKTRMTMIFSAGLAIGLPLLGVGAAGCPISTYLEFPPLTRYVEHAGFSWVAFILMAALVLCVYLPLVVHSIRCRYALQPGVPARLQRTFPWWGWLGFAGVMLSWLLSWTRFGWFEPLQRFTFGPLWLAYIVVVNAWTLQRSGRCMMLDRSRMFAALFVLSAAFWWYFEYLNRFVQNWYYEGVEGLSPTAYFLLATIPFATVLPAVLGTYEWLKTFPGLGAGLDQFIKIKVKHGTTLAVAALLTASLSLAGLGLWPDYLFPLLWTSPLLIVIGLKTLAGVDTVFTPLREGRWRNICLLALASLICGGFWEMWNMYSLAKWIYAVPFVGEFKIFEMPLLGFSGYLSFGIECAVIAEFVGYDVTHGCGDTLAGRLPAGSNKMNEWRETRMRKIAAKMDGV